MLTHNCAIGTRTMQASRGVYVCAHILTKCGVSPFDGSPRYSAVHCWLENVNDKDVTRWSTSFDGAKLWSAEEAEFIIQAVKNMPEYNVSVFEVHFHTEHEMATAASIPANIRELLKL